MKQLSHGATSLSAIAMLVLLLGDRNCTGNEIGLAPKIRRTGVGGPLQGQLGFRLRF